MDNNDDQGSVIQDAVIDQVQSVFERAKEELEKIQCPNHGPALKKLEFDRSSGRFKIETCCDDGEKLINDAIATLT